jgi:hypothetical protein
VGTWRKEIARICSPNPGNILSQTASVASGVTSLGAGPVPPVVIITEQPALQSSIKDDSMTSFSSGTTRLSIVYGLEIATERNSAIAGPDKSS